MKNHFSAQLLSVTCDSYLSVEKSLLRFLLQCHAQVVIYDFSTLYSSSSLCLSPSHDDLRGAEEQTR